MKRILVLIIFILTAAVLLSGCVMVNFSPGSVGGVKGSGSYETYSFRVGEINEINVEMYCDIVYYSAPSDTVTLEIQPNLKEYIKVEEIGGVLTVKATRNINWSGKVPVLTVSTPSLTRISLLGAGTIIANDTITADSFSLILGGAGTGKADMNVDELSVILSGAGSFELSGTADKASYILSGAGKVEALSLLSRTADVNIAGAGTVRLSCSDNLSITAGGIGTVEYRGSPTLDLTRGGLVNIKQLS